jgi:hypothetical protein
MPATIVSALLPALITVLLGYLAARHHDFGLKDALILSGHDPVGFQPS